MDTLKACGITAIFAALAVTALHFGAYSAVRVNNNFVKKSGDKPCH